MEGKRVIVIGGGLSGLTAANELLKTNPDIHLTVLQALDRVGGRTHSVDINGFIFDNGAEFIGQSQKHVIELAKESGNELVEVYHKGTKIIEMNRQIFTYESDIPNNLNVLGLLHLQFLIWKINRMSKKVPTLDPRDSELGYYWDTMSTQTWIDDNIKIDRVKVMVQVAIRSLFGAQPCEISFLFFLWSVHQNKDFDNMINIKNGLQGFKTKLGTQHMSKYLREQIEQKKGRIELGVKVKGVEQRESLCIVHCWDGKIYEGDYLLIACAPLQVNKIEFSPQLSMDRKLLCERALTGSYVKVIILYRKAYWRENGFSGEILTDCSDSPLMTAFDDTKVNHQGEVQPALIVFLAGSMYRYWKERKDFERSLVEKIADLLKVPEMRDPITVQWTAWEDQPTVNGGPTGLFGPGVLTQVSDLRKPEGLIHWAGTELASVSTGYMDGAIESGKRAAKELELRLKGQALPSSKLKNERGLWYTNYLRGARKWLDWL